MSLRVRWEHRLGDAEPVEYGYGSLKQCIESHCAWVKEAEALGSHGYEAATEVAVGRGKRPKLRWRLYGSWYGSAYCYCYWEHYKKGLRDHVELEAEYRKERGL